MVTLNLHLGLLLVVPPPRTAWAGGGTDASSTLHRMQRGLPLLSADKLPRWAMRTTPQEEGEKEEGKEGEEEGVAEREGSATIEAAISSGAIATSPGAAGAWSGGAVRQLGSGGSSAGLPMSPGGGRWATSPAAEVRWLASLRCR